MTKQEVLDNLQDHPENSLLWDAIADLLSEFDELERLQGYSVLDANVGYEWEFQPYSPRLDELEKKFGV